MFVLLLLYVEQHTSASGKQSKTEADYGREALRLEAVADDAADAADAWNGMEC